MIWNNDYELLPAARSSATKEMKRIINLALDNAKNNLTDGWSRLDEDFIIITVEGFSCVALITNEFQPYEICTRVFPFDENRIYPMQEIETKVQFKIYR